MIVAITFFIQILSFFLLTANVTQTILEVEDIPPVPETAVSLNNQMQLRTAMPESKYFLVKTLSSTHENVTRNNLTYMLKLNFLSKMENK